MREFRLCNRAQAIRFQAGGRAKKRPGRGGQPSAVLLATKPVGEPQVAGAGGGCPCCCWLGGATMTGTGYRNFITSSTRTSTKYVPAVLNSTCPNRVTLVACRAASCKTNFTSPLRNTVVWSG